MTIKDFNIFIIMENKYYLYCYYRHDKNVPFYIGIGTKRKRNYKSYRTEYERAFSLTNRNKHFLNIIKTTETSVEIIFETNSLDIIKKKEKEFILLYGRIDKNNGPLVNLTDGGDGHYNMSNDNRNKLSELCSKRFKGKKLSEGQRTKIGQSQIGRKMDEKTIKLRTEVRKNNAIKRGYYVPPDKILKESVPVIQYDLNMQFIKEWTSISDAHRELNIGKSNIINVCKMKKKYKTAGGFIWRYKFPQ